MNQKALTKLVQEEMKKRNWSIAKLALEADVAYETARRVKRGIGIASLDTSEKILAALGHEMNVKSIEPSNTQLDLTMLNQF